MRTLLIVGMLLLAGCLQAETPESNTDGEQAAPPSASEPTILGNASANEPALNAQLQAQPKFHLTTYDGAEPNMGITSSGAIFASAGSNIIRSTNGGEDWTVVHTHQLTNSDPMMWVDVWTDCIYNVPMFPILLGSMIYESCDDGDTWSPIHSQQIGKGAMDHQKFASMPPGPDAPAIAGIIDESVFIICYNALIATQCTMSYDGGRTWPYELPIWNTAQGPACSGQQSHPTGSWEGVIVVAKAWGCADAFIMVSYDSGMTWETRFPGFDGGADTLDPEIAFDEDNGMYMLWQSKAGESRAKLAYSPDYGQSWEGPWDITPTGMNSTIFAALGAGSSGRIAATFHATNNTGSPGEMPADAEWYTYSVISENANTANPTFVAHRMTEDPIQIGGICKGNRGCTDGNRNLLDFIDGAISPEGTWYTVIAVGCVGECQELRTPASSRSGDVAIVKLEGWSLYA